MMPMVKTATMIRASDWLEPFWNSSQTNLPRITSYNVCYTKLLRDVSYIELTTHAEFTPQFVEAMYFRQE